jgi:hypothetical protein
MVICTWKAVQLPKLFQIINSNPGSGQLPKSSQITKTQSALCEQLCSFSKSLIFVDIDHIANENGMGIYV